MLRLRPLTALLALALAVPFAACGDGNDAVNTAKTESVYVTTGGLRYQVQVSRKLNPYDVEDKDYLVGVPKAAEQVANPTTTWFGVFIRAENRTGLKDVAPQTIESAPSFWLQDNEGNKAYPTALPKENVYGYQSVPIPPKGQLPAASSTAASAPIGGALILFKVDQGILERRPTQLHIQSADGSKAVVNLDI